MQALFHQSEGDEMAREIKPPTPMEIMVRKLLIRKRWKDGIPEQKGREWFALDPPRRPAAAIWRGTWEAVEVA